MDIYEIGTLPEPGVVPEYMYAQTLRQNRYGEPAKAFEIEKVKVPEIKEDEVLVAVMAAGLNYNSVWAATAYPLDMIMVMQYRNEIEDDYFIAGSDCSGIVYKVGSEVTNVKVGDEIVVHAGWGDMKDPWIVNGGDPESAPSCRAWGYETTYGSFAQFCKVKYFQCLPKPKHLSWEQAAVYVLSAATVYRMLFKFEPHTVKKDDVVLIWGGAGGLGTIAIQMVKMVGGIPLAVVNSADKMDYCRDMGALVLNRNDYNHWGEITSEMLQPFDPDAWRFRAKPFIKDIYKLTNGKLPKIVLEHPGEATFPTSVYVCDKNGMVVTCAGTTGYAASFDVRYLWLNRKRVQGSHFANNEDCAEMNQLVIDKKVWPVLSETVSFEELPQALQLMYDNKHKGNTAVRVGYRG